MLQSAVEILVNDFCKAWERRGLDAIQAMMDKDIVYWNVRPRPRCGGVVLYGSS